MSAPMITSSTISITIKTWLTLSSSCPKSYIAKCLTLPLRYIWSDDRLRRTGVYSEGGSSAIYVAARRKVVALLYGDCGALACMSQHLPLSASSF